MPGRAQHVGAQDGAVVEKLCKIGLVGPAGAGGDRPPGLAGVLRLYGEKRTDDLSRRRGVRRDEVLAAQPPAGDVDVPHGAPA